MSENVEQENPVNEKTSEGFFSMFNDLKDLDVIEGMGNLVDSAGEFTEDTGNFIEEKTNINLGEEGGKAFKKAGELGDEALDLSEEGLNRTTSFLKGIFNSDEDAIKKPEGIKFEDIDFGNLGNTVNQVNRNLPKDWNIRNNPNNGRIELHKFGDPNSKIKYFTINDKQNKNLLTLDGLQKWANKKAK